MAYNGIPLAILDARYVNVTGDNVTGTLSIRSKNELRFYDNGNYVGFEAPDLAADQIWVLPTADGNASDFLQTNGSGALSWAAGSGAPTDVDYWVETADGDLSAEVVVGTTGITTAAYGSRQAAAKAGRLFLPNDGFYIERDTGSAWASWGPIHPFTAPVSGDFAWINQGGASVKTTEGGIYIEASAGAGQNLRIRKKAAPGVPYVITAYVSPLSLSLNNTMGITFRQSSDGKLHALLLAGRSGDGVSLYSYKYTNPTTLSASYALFDLGDFLPEGAPHFLRIADDNTNRICSISHDGQNFKDFHTVGRTDFLTADEVGFFVNSVDGTYSAGMTLLHWEET